MIEIRTFDGAAEEAAQFIVAVWRETYGGVVPIPLWSPAFFEWVLPARSSESEHYFVAAYDGGKLVGTLFAEACRFRVRGTQVSGSTASWFAVSRDYARQGIGRRIWSEMCRRHTERGDSFILGWLYRSPRARSGYNLTSTASKLDVLSEVGFWIRVLDHHAVARWEPTWALARAMAGLGYLQGRVKSIGAAEGVRDYAPTDLPRCLSALEDSERELELGHAWTADRLARQLQHGDLPRTVVAEEGGHVRGFINYYPLETLGKQQLLTATVDLVALNGLSSDAQRRLVAYAVARMKQEGIGLVMIPGPACRHWYPLIRNGFLPVPPQLTLATVATDTSDCLRGVRKVYTLVR